MKIEMRVNPLTHEIYYAVPLKHFVLQDPLPGICLHPMERPSWTCTPPRYGEHFRGAERNYGTTR
jgi:hypothetical protein